MLEILKETDKRAYTTENVKLTIQGLITWAGRGPFLESPENFSGP